MQLGNFSVSLAVKDLQASKAFYEALGFAMVMGDVEQGWTILKNGETNLGLFQGMFEQNMLTFNPGWDHQGNALSAFTDIRELQQQLKAAGVTIAQEASEGTEPTSLLLLDPDGNPILIDQHVPKPAWSLSLQRVW